MFRLNRIKKTIAPYLPALISLTYYMFAMGISFYLIHNLDGFGLQIVLSIVLFSINGIWFLSKRYAKRPIRSRRERKFHRISILVYSMICSTVVCTPGLVLADPPGGGGGGAVCTNMGFLSPIGTFTIQIFNGITAAGAQSISDQACRVALLILWVFVVAALAGILFACSRLFSGSGDMAQLLQPVIGILAFFLIAGILFILAFSNNAGVPAQ